MLPETESLPCPPDLVAAIAARYGASVAPGVAVQRLAIGASSRPYPVWDEAKNTLVVPDWKEQKAARQRAGVKAGQVKARRERADQTERLQKLCALHDAGARVPAMAAALGISKDYVYALLSRMGRKMERDPEQFVGSARRMIEGRRALMEAQAAERSARIVALVAAGADEAAIRAALGIADRDWCRKLIRRAVPDFPFEVRRRGPAPRPDRIEARARAAARTPMPGRSEIAARNAAVIARHDAGDTVEAIRAATGLSRLVVARLLRNADRVPRYAAETAHAALIAELPQLVAQGMVAAEIAVRWGRTVKAVHSIAARVKVSLRPAAAHNKGKVSEAVTRRREWVAAMVRRGASDAEMLAVLKIHVSTLSEDIKVLGLSGARRKARAAQGESGDVTGVAA